MKVYRSPKLSDDWQLADSKPSDQWASTWKPGTMVVVDGNTNKDSERRTKLGVSIEGDDIIALTQSLYRAQLEQIDGLKKKLEQSEKEYWGEVGRSENLRYALSLVEQLVERHVQKAPNVAELLSAIKLIASHFLSDPDIDTLPSLSWISCDDILK